MATHRVSKTSAIRLYLSLLLVAAATIVFICISFDGVSIRNHNQVTIPQNFKLVQNGNQAPFGSNSIQKVNEVVKMNEGFKLPPNFFMDPAMSKPLTFQMMDPNDKDCPVNMELLEWNKKLIDCINNPPDSPKCQIKNFNQVPIKKLNPQEEAELDRLFQTAKTMEEVHFPSKSKTVNKFFVNSDTCSESEIEQIISDSIVEPEHRRPEWAICNLIKTETELQRHVLNSNTSTRYMVAYICLMLPLIIIYYMHHCRMSDLPDISQLKSIAQHDVIDSYSFAKFGDYKQHNTGSLFEGSFSKVLHLLTGIGDSYQPKPNKGLLQYDNISMSNTVSKSVLGTSLFKSQDLNLFNNGKKGNGKVAKSNGYKSRVSKAASSQEDKFCFLCEYCNEYSDNYCPNHSHLYSTDEASSSEAEFCQSDSKAKDRKHKKRSKEVKKNRTAF